MWSVYRFITFFIFCTCVSQVFAENQTTTTPTSGGNRNEGRFVPSPPHFFPSIAFPLNSATGLLVAIAIPVTDLPYQTAFVSYNFELGYNMPNLPETSEFIAKNLNSDVKTAFLKNASIKSMDQQNTSMSTISNTLAASPTSGNSCKRDVNETLAREEARLIEQQNFLNNRILFTRRGFYKLVESRLDAGGIKGKKCLLLAICEASRFPFFDINGVLGNIIHIILTPSTSIKEDLPPEFEKAEKAGSSGGCAKYERQCNVNVLDVFSKII